MNDRLDDLVDQYQELLDAGRVPNLADLCRDCPDLRDELGRRVVRLHLGRSDRGDGPDALACERAEGLEGCGCGDGCHGAILPGD